MSHVDVLAMSPSDSPDLVTPHLLELTQCSRNCLCRLVSSLIGKRWADAFAAESAVLDRYFDILYHYEDEVLTSPAAIIYQCRKPHFQ